MCINPLIWLIWYEIGWYSLNLMKCGVKVTKPPCGGGTRLLQYFRGHHYVVDLLTTFLDEYYIYWCSTHQYTSLKYKKVHFILGRCKNKRPFVWSLVFIIKSVVYYWLFYMLGMKSFYSIHICNVRIIR